MRLSISYLFLCLLLTHLFGSWLVLPTPSPDSLRQQIESFSFISPDTGYISAIAYPGPELDAVWKTTNGGISFQNVKPPNCGIRWSSSIQFFNDTGYLYGVSYNVENLWKTTDCGNNWGCVLTVIPDSGPLWISPCLSFLNSNYGYVTVPKNQSLYKTIDGGITWSSLLVPCVMLFNICFSDTITGYLSGREQYEDNIEYVWKTTNGGISWQKVFSSDKGFWDSHCIQFPSRDIGYISTGLEGFGSDVYKTTDGGSNWERIFSKGQINSMSFFSNDTGYVTAYGKIYKTTNGRDFFKLALPIRCYYMYPIQFIKGTQTGYANCFDDGAGHSIAVLKTVDGGGESLGFWQPLSTMPDKPKKGALLTAYPYSNSLFLQEIGKEHRLWSYDVIKDSWYDKKPFSEKLKRGASITGNEDGLFVLCGSSNQCWNYDPEDNSWLKLPDIIGDNVVKNGGCITTDAEGNLYVLKGGKTNEFYAFNKESNLWQKKPDIPGTHITKGASIACDNEYVYAIKGGRTNEFWSYSINGDSWHRLTDIISKGFQDGSCLSANPYAEEGNGVLTLKGGGQECWYYGSYWKMIPGIPGRKKIKKGAQLTVDENNVFYAIKNNRMTQIWQTDEFVATTNNKPKETKNIQSDLVKSDTKDEIRITNPTDKIRFSLPEDWTTYSIYNITGKLIRTVTRPDNTGLGLNIPQGIYFIRLKTAKLTLTKKLIVTR